MSSDLPLATSTPQAHNALCLPLSCLSLNTDNLSSTTSPFPSSLNACISPSSIHTTRPLAATSSFSITLLYVVSSPATMNVSDVFAQDADSRVWYPSNVLNQLHVTLTHSVRLSTPSALFHPSSHPFHRIGGNHDPIRRPSPEEQSEPFNILLTHISRPRLY